ncbi:alpha/beta fold hydrolase [Nocardia sp. NPDC052278]|uniref:alpha/beta fold hydrolase n=1 Tax=unclassified Nocardia TaxID=2637762 RepID=UPI0036C39491
MSHGLSGLVVSEVPEWFARSVREARKEQSIEVDGVSIALRWWGRPGAPGVVLVHGGAAHSRWWDHIAPMLGDYRVVAIDLSGHGRSGRRDLYSVRSWTAELVAVCGLPEIGPRPVVIAHSMGGWVSLNAGAEAGDLLGGVIVIDSPVRERSPEEMEASSRRAFGPLRTYPDPETALGHFRTVPEQPNSLPFVVDHIARHSLVRTEAGWQWRFDPKIFGNAKPRPEMLRRVGTRVALLRAEHGLLTRTISDDMYELLGRRAPVVEIPEAGHHPMLDQPLSLITALRALLADWGHSEACSASR